MIPEEMIVICPSWRKLHKKNFALTIAMNLDTLKKEIRHDAAECHTRKQRTYLRYLKIWFSSVC